MYLKGTSLNTDRALVHEWKVNNRIYRSSHRGKVEKLLGRYLMKIQK